jgi:hypothetical protein
MFPPSQALTPQQRSSRSTSPLSKPKTPNFEPHSASSRKNTHEQQLLLQQKQQQQQQQQQKHGPSTLIHRRSWGGAQRPSSSTASSPPAAAAAHDTQRCAPPAARPQTSPAAVTATDEHTARTICDEVGLSLHSFAKVQNKTKTTHKMSNDSPTSLPSHAMPAQALPEAKKPPQPAVSEHNV